MGEGERIPGTTEDALWRELMHLRKRGFWRFRARECQRLAELCGPPASGEPPEAPIRRRLLDLLDPPPVDDDGRALPRPPLAGRRRDDPGLFGRVLFGEAPALAFEDGPAATLRFDSRTRGITARYRDLAQLRHTSVETIRKTPKRREPRGGPAYQLMGDLVGMLARAPASATPAAAQPVQPPPRRRPDRRLLPVLAVAAAALLGLVAWGLARSGRGAAAHDRSGCVILDAARTSASTRRVYLSEFGAFAQAIGTDGSGRLCLVVVGQGALGAPPRTIDVGPPAGEADDRAFAAATVKARVESVSQSLRASLDASSLSRHASGLVEAAAEAARTLTTGDALLILSDGVQSSRETGAFTTVPLDEAAVERLVERLARDGLVPRLSGVEVLMPHLLAAPPEGSRMTQRRVHSIERFWEAWARRSGASLRLGL